MARIQLIDVCKTLRTKSFHLLSSRENRSSNEITFSLENISLDIPSGHITVILGPSGCGKTTLLKIIAGLIKADSGRILFNGMNMEEVAPGERKIGMVFQDYALYPHLDSKTNILSYFLFKRKTAELYETAKEKFDRTSELMGVEIKYLLHRMPNTLSGGEKQRVAIGRCITRDPAVFLLDEPFLNLDQMLKDKYRVNMKHLLKQFSVTTVYVTHDQQEALIFADHIAVMNKGAIEQVGSYEEIYNNPNSVFVASFLNTSIHTTPINFIDGNLVSEKYANFTVGVRPEDISISEVMKPGLLKSVVREINYMPLIRSTIMETAINGTTIQLQKPEKTEISAGSVVWLGFDKIHTFDKATGKRIKTDTNPD
ncbi:MAG: ABC transporter ATP-binding protein [Spirochaetales bacterium]|nr:ABC transporter ATP-binding protein [Spirochaetales bacterium]